ncbi:PLP-dependent transferase [Glonium stellatum]|uniref:PLP-dependent transferase n=1 Tax=Glonium stellatum TaxID=574774 RepID=A0A8E2JYI3_9PEZI|nr:PLP-dependent transferase [Glonium stellatum]
MSPSFTLPSADTSNELVTVYNERIEGIRDEQYPMLKGKIYLDHGGTTLYAKSLVRKFSDDLISNLYGNPHSASTPSTLAGDRVDEIRIRALHFFNADPDHFDLIFVSNATAAIKLVAESFRDYPLLSENKRSKGFWYGYHRDAHTSLVGVREITHGSHWCFRDDEEVNQWIHRSKNGAKVKIGPLKGQIGLFAFPGQSNMTGRRLPMTWPSELRSKKGAKIYTLLDAAALATTCPINLSNEEAPDFTCISFYKIFGFPNIGALIVRKEAGHMLQRRKYFGGGTVDMIISLGATWHAKKESSLHDRLEDGTLPFHSIFALGHALDVHQQLFESMSRISAHTAYLAKQLFDGMSALTHYNGLPVCRIYRDPEAIYGNPKTQGATIAFNILKPDGALVKFNEIEKSANDNGIYIRAGGLCNPGGIATFLQFDASRLKAAFAAGHRCSQPLVTIDGRPIGVVRVSLGAMSTLSDINTLLTFLRKNYVAESLSSELQSSSKSSINDLVIIHEKTTHAISTAKTGKVRKQWINYLISLVRTKKDVDNHPRVSP